jgi:dihydrofolate synthase/folylpolyglutamate synthase
VNARRQNRAPLGELIARLSALHPKRVDLDLERMHRLLAAARAPRTQAAAGHSRRRNQRQGLDDRLLEGDSGSGGLARHAYTSPYLVRVNECFRLAGRRRRLVDDDELRAALEHCEQVNAGAPITIFEIENRGRPFCCSRSIRPTWCCWKSVSAGGSTPPT